MKWLIFLVLVPALLVSTGCQRGHSPASATQANAKPRPVVVTKEIAIGIVRAMALKDGEEAEFDCKETADGFCVSVQWFYLDKDGNRVYTTGGFAVFLLSKNGDLLKEIGGL